MHKVNGNMDDNELVGQAKQDDLDAFARLSSRYVGLIYHKAAAIAEKMPDMELDDLTQEGYIGFYKAVKSFSPDGGASFRTYAGVCVQNQMISAVRRYRKKGSVPPGAAISIDQKELQNLSGSEGPEDSLEAGEAFQELLARVQLQLSPMERKAFSLYAQGLEKREIETQMGVSRKVLDNAIYRVRRKLKQLSAAHFHT